MAILTERDRTAVRTELAKLAGPVKLVVFSTQLGASEYCVETERLVREVAECSDQVTVEILNLHIDRERAAAYGVDRVPAIVVEGARDYGIRFFGIPMGYEFTNLIDCDARRLVGHAVPRGGDARAPGRPQGAGPHPGLLDPHLTPLPPGRAPGAASGRRLGVDPRRLRGGQRVSRTGAALHGHGRAEDGGQRPRHRSRAPCPRPSSSTRSCGRSARPGPTAPTAPRRTPRLRAAPLTWEQLLLRSRSAPCSSSSGAAGSADSRHGGAPGRSPGRAARGVSARAPSRRRAAPRG